MTDNSRVKKAGPALAASAVIAAIIVATPFVQRFEGRRTLPYRDVAGYLTVCDGHVGPDIVAGRRYSTGECNAILEADLRRHTEAMAQCIKVDVPTPSLAAFVSFAFNVGPAAFCRSTVAKKLNAGDLRGACAGLSAWVYAGGKKWPGLVRRRAAERALCEEGL